MQTPTQKNPEMRALTDDELDAVGGGRLLTRGEGILGQIFTFFHELFAGVFEPRRP